MQYVHRDTDRSPCFRLKTPVLLVGVVGVRARRGMGSALPKRSHQRCRDRDGGSETLGKYSCVNSGLGFKPTPISHRERSSPPTTKLPMRKAVSRSSSSRRDGGYLISTPTLMIHRRARSRPTAHQQQRNRRLHASTNDPTHVRTVHPVEVCLESLALGWGHIQVRVHGLPQHIFQRPRSPQHAAPPPLQSVDDYGKSSSVEGLASFLERHYPVCPPGMRLSWCRPCVAARTAFSTACRGRGRGGRGGAYFLLVRC